MKEEIIRDEGYSRKVLLSLLLLTLFVILMISLSFSLYIKKQKDSIKKEDRISKISMNYTEDTNGISIENAMPIEDEIGKKQTNDNEYFDFTVNYNVVGDAKIEYEITAIKDSNSTINDSDVKLYLEEQKSGEYVQTLEPKEFTPISSSTSTGSPNGSMVLKKVIKTASGSSNYRLRMWIKKDANVEADKKYTVRINVYGKQINGG